MEDKNSPTKGDAEHLATLEKTVADLRQSRDKLLEKRIKLDKRRKLEEEKAALEREIELLNRKSDSITPRHIGTWDDGFPSYTKPWGYVRSLKHRPEDTDPIMMYHLYLNL